jgi:uncharacterized membrane protein
MEEWIQYMALNVGLTIEAIAIVVIAVGALEAAVGTCKVLVFSRATGFQRREVWLNFARWLIAGLTFQLAADIVRTTVAPSWDDIGKLAAIAVIRTFLTYFLDRDKQGMLQEQRETSAAEVQHAARG